MTGPTTLAVFLALVVRASPSPVTSDTGHFQYISPRPGAELVSRGTTIVVRPADPYRTRGRGMLASMRVQGSVSGSHTGERIVAEDFETFAFRPHRPFEPGERVSVALDLPGRDDGTFSFRFTVSPKRTEPDLTGIESFPSATDAPALREGTPRYSGFSGRGGTYTPPEDFPSFEVTALDNPDAGFLFLAKEGTTGRYLMILDDTGFPGFFRSMSGLSRDFKKQPNGLLTYFERVAGPAVRAMDSTYTVVDEWLPGNGYDDLDSHDFQLLPNGHALMFYRDAQTVDMSEVVPGGDPSALVLGLVIHEVDVNKNLVFEWRSWDHFEITDASTLDLTAPVIDYVHCNAIESDVDGHILISSRHLDEITKIDRQTGDIIWRMGGSQNEFTLVGDVQWYSRQHSIRRTASGTVTIFDNGNLNTPQESRVVEYDLDEANKVATLVWEFRQTPAVYAPHTGNAQRLSNGNTLISWGPLGIVTEVRPDGTKAFEMNFSDPSHETYRAFRFPWSGVAAAPYLWAQAAPDSVTLHFAKFGDPNVVQFNIYRGSSPNPTTVVGSTGTNSFVLEDVAPSETLYVRVTAEDEKMIESPFSNELEIVVPPSSVEVPAASGVMTGLTLLQNHPNPFGPITSIRFVLPDAAHADLSVYSVGGRLVRTLADSEVEGGTTEVVWDGRDARGRSVSAGIYFYRLKTGGQSMTKRMTLVK
jgi:hypothetical protein